MLSGMTTAAQPPPSAPGPDTTDWFSHIFDEPSTPPLPTTASHRSVRKAIADVLEHVNANELAEECVRFGLEPSLGDNDDPWRGKWRYVERRLILQP